MFTLLAHIMGIDNSSGPIYLFWSGFGSDLGEATLIGIILNWYKQHKCARCWRLSRHDVHGTHYATCHIHFTEDVHKSLQRRHERKFPKQHAYQKKLSKM